MWKWNLFFTFWATIVYYLFVFVFFFIFLLLVNEVIRTPSQIGWFISQQITFKNKSGLLHMGSE